MKQNNYNGQYGNGYQPFKRNTEEEPLGFFHKYEPQITAVLITLVTVGI